MKCIVVKPSHFQGFLCNFKIEEDISISWSPCMFSDAVVCQRSLFTFLSTQNRDLFEIRTLLEIFISPDDDETHFFSNYACIPLVQVAAAIRHWYALEKNSDHMWWMCVRSGNVGSHKEMWGGTIQDE